MFIGSLLSKESEAGISLSVFHGRTDRPYFSADKVPPFGTKDWFFSGFSVFDNAVDVVMEGKTAFFADHINCSVSSSENGEVSGLVAEILSRQNGEETLLSRTVVCRDGLTALPINAYAKTLVVRLYQDPTGAKHPERPDLPFEFSEFAEFTLDQLDLVGAVGLEEAVYPTPSSLKFKEGHLLPTGVNADGEAAFAGENFREKFADRFGKSLFENGNVTFKIADLETEEFTLTVNENGATVRGGSYRALLFASEKLLQLCDGNGIRCAELHDKPALPMRGVHLALPEKDQVEFLKRMVKYVFMPMGYNTVFLELAGAMEYHSHPEISRGWEEMCRLYQEGKLPQPPHYNFLGHTAFSHEEIADFCDWFRKYGLEIVPEVETFGHTQYITYSHPELAEKPEDGNADMVQADTLNADKRPDEVYYHTMCPNHPGYYPMIFSLIDEVVDLIRPERYVHIGHDEIYQLCQCPTCKKQGGAAVYSKEVTAVHDYLKEKGLGTMLWSDMMEETAYASAPAVALIPKDVVCLSFTWYFHLSETLEIEDRLIDNGLSFMTGNLYSSHFPRFNKRKGKPNYLGGEVSTWIPCNENYYAYEGKIYDFLFSAEMLWNPNFREDIRPIYTEILKKRLPTVREYIHCGKLPRKTETETLPLFGDPKAVPFDLRNECENAVCVASGREVLFPVGRFADRLVVTHATDIDAGRLPWQRIGTLGTYVFNYEDGTTAETPIAFGLHIGKYRFAFGTPLPSRMFRHEGYMATYPAEPICLKTENGEDATLYRYAIDNPHPEKKIVSLTLRNFSERMATILVFGIEKQRILYN